MIFIDIVKYFLLYKTDVNVTKDNLPSQDNIYSRP
jgi:hypothetical protein